MADVIENLSSRALKYSAAMWAIEIEEIASQDRASRRRTANGQRHVDRDAADLP